MSERPVAVEDLPPLYKLVRPDGRPILGHPDFHWPLPSGKRPGAWVEVGDDRLRPCGYGLHALTKEHVIDWIGTVDDALLCRIELAKEVIYETSVFPQGRKYVGRRGRLTRVLLRLDEATRRTLLIRSIKRHQPKSPRLIAAIERLERGEKFDYPHDYWSNSVASLVHTLARGKLPVFAGSRPRRRAALIEMIDEAEAK